MNKSEDLGHGLFSAISITTPTNETMHVFAVRVHTGKKYCTVLRFLHSFLDHAQDLMDTWVASPKGLAPSPYQYSGCYSGVNGEFKRTFKDEVKESCDVLTFTQRSADWFL